MVSSPFSGLVGQSTAVALLTRAVQQQRVAPAYLFAGPEGVGRRRAALALAEWLLHTPSSQAGNLRHRLQQGNHPDLLWVEPTYLHQGRPVTVAEAMELGLRRKSPPQIRLEQVRQIGGFLSRPALEAAQSLVIIEAAETMAEAAANGLLKTLEEPGRATLILLAPDATTLLPTLISRCQTIPFVRLAAADLQQVLQQTGHTDILRHPEVLAMAQGSPGHAIACWQQLQTIPADLLTTLHRPPRSLRDALERARHITSTLDTETQLWLIDYLQQHYWQQGLTTLAILQRLEQARRQLRSFVQPRLVWEVAWMEMVG
ncbi:DNA polymerase III subunit delta' [Halomicronema hongdechloris C2206]|uniref:DNA polymerase III subunit delta n=1 Tax=Halomicronema hongdechloris C2206 TaxID=1641165 RepID=A0A1Z3HNY9_9CYAN|nr:DNA polymerase III subunit delta' [Halomicronema hongdechloris]ASC71990.1 DNA polymerase III subunit delta' [Halomicronema hongdechloris C2206]